MFERRPVLPLPSLHLLADLFLKSGPVDIFDQIFKFISQEERIQEWIILTQYSNVFLKTVEA